MARPKARFAIAATVAAIAGLLLFASSTQRDRMAPVDVEARRQGNLRSVESFHLENGIEVIVVPIADAAKTVVMAWYRVGSADDPAEMPGLAHYVEHVTFGALGAHKGSPEAPRATAAKGAQPEAFTSYDYTAYYHVAPKEEVARALRIEAMRLSRLSIDDGAIEGEREAVVDERKHDIDSDAHALLEEKLRSVVFSGSPYGRPVVAAEADTRRATLEEVKWFWERRYRPGNLVLVIAGAVDPATLLPLVEASFKGIDAKPVEARTRPAPTRPRHRRLVIEAKEADDTLWARIFVVPSFATADHREILSLQMLAWILANENIGRLERAVVKQFHIAKEVTIEYQPDAVGDASFTIHATLARRADIPQIERAFDNELANIASGSIAPEELTEACERVLQRFMAVWDDPLEAASLLGTARMTGRSISDVITCPQLLSSISAEDIRAAATKLSTNRFEVTGVVRGSTR